MEIENCSCGSDHETMPMVDMSTCFCLFVEDSKCNHEVIMVEAVCREHKRHEPCRPCMRLDSERQ